MAIRWYSVVVDCRDVASQARWWANALGWPIIYEAPEEVIVAPPDERGPGLVFVPVPEGKQVKNRLHIDLAPQPADNQAAEVDRLLELGATRADIGQGDDVSWVVLADPEGNEFCVLSSRP